MEFSTALATELALLTGQLDLDAGDLSDLLVEVVEHATAAVPSLVGLQLVIMVDQLPVRLRTFEPELAADSIQTSILIPLPLLGVAGASGSITLYATAPGAFVELAADHAYALGPRDPSPDQSKVASKVDTGDDRPRFRLDDDLRPDLTGPTVSGLADVSSVNQAVGALVDRGQHPDGAHGELDRRAAVAGLTKAGYAAWFLQHLHDPHEGD